MRRLSNVKFRSGLSQSALPTVSLTVSLENIHQLPLILASQREFYICNFLRTIFQ